MTRHSKDLPAAAGSVIQAINDLRLEKGVDAALSWLNQASPSDLADSAVQHLIGHIWLTEKGSPEKALAFLEQAVALSPKQTDYRTTLAECLCRLDRPRQALNILEHLAPEELNTTEINDLLATVYSTAGLESEHISALRRATDLDPENADRSLMLAETLAQANQSENAFAAFELALKHHPDNAAIAASFGAFLLRMGRTAEAIDALKSAQKIDPTLETVPSLLLLYLMFVSNTTKDDFVRAGRQWNAVYRPDTEVPPHKNSAAPDRRLKIGYVSGDLVWHSIIYFFHPLLAHRDRSQFEVYCYSNTPQMDSGTTMLREQVDHWRDITEIDDRAAAELIRKDEIDILLDMSGHMKSNRQPLFGLRPAPVQIGWQGYVGSRYTSVLDYWITDEVTDPVDETYPDNCGRPLRIPGGYHLYEPDPEARFPVAPLPYERNGCVTFGSFNQQGKIQPKTVELWAQVLNAVPGSRLLLKATGFSDPWVVDYFRNIFADHGITADRLLFVGPKVIRRHHFELYSQVDVALDTFPHHGITTTCEALWMGVPVIVLKGSRTESRVGAGLMKQVGLDDWVAETPDNYVRIATHAAAHPTQLSELRRGMRERMTSSQLGDPTLAIPAYEAALRSVWQRWCASHQ